MRIIRTLPLYVFVYMTQGAYNTYGIYNVYGPTLITWASFSGISDKVSFKPVSSATETSYKIEMSPVAS